MRRIALVAPLLLLTGCASVQEWYGNLRARSTGALASAESSPSSRRSSSRIPAPSEMVEASPRSIFPAPPRVDSESPFYDTIVLEPAVSSVPAPPPPPEQVERVPMAETAREPRLFEPPAL